MARTRPCDACDGWGYLMINDQKIKCDNCLGSGYVPIDQPRVKRKK